MNPWIPYSAAVVWTVAFAVVMVVHVGHAVVMSWRHRVWHAGHVVMAAGMLVMFWPGESLLGIPAIAGIWAYALAAGVLTLGLVIGQWRGVRLGWLWLISVADFAAMAYMFALMSIQLAWLSVVAAVWFTAQTIGWISGWLGRVLERGGLGDPVPATHPVPPGTETAAQPEESQPPTGPATQPEPAAAPTTVTARVTTAVRRHIIDGGRRDWSIRITLAVMAAGMGYMMLAMQFGMPTMGHMASM